MKNSLDFYKDLPSVSEFVDVMDLSRFVEAPDDWLVVMTDVKGSTDAIRGGRYREVNVLGAAGIMALLNQIPQVQLPYVFGGDGATILVPEKFQAEAMHALSGVQRLSERRFGLHLRVGMVPVRTLKNLGFPLRVAKYELSEGNVLAQFAGGGASKAEELIKNDHEGSYNLSSRNSPSHPNLNGLSCRLEPFESRKGTMLTLLVTAADGPQSASETYTRLIRQIEKILGHSLRVANPVTSDGLRWKWPPVTIWTEIKTQSKGWNLPWVILRILLRTLVSHFILTGHRTVGGFNSLKYKKELVINTDSTKFDDVLRMVMDCSVAESEAIEKHLQSLHRDGHIRYGIHRSPQALMTCIVFSAAENRHLHFVDGSHGGYAMAAVGLKGQKKS